MPDRRDFLGAVTGLPFIGSARAANARSRDTHTYAPGRPALLRVLATEGLWERYADQPEKCCEGLLVKAVQSRLDTELIVINRRYLTGFFLCLAEVAQYCREAGIPFSLRGPAAGSLVAYGLGLTDACPLQHGLLFERFLNADSTRVPAFAADIHPCSRQAILGRFPAFPSEDTGMPEFELLDFPPFLLLQRDVELVERNTGAKVTFRDSDSDTFLLFQRGDTDGIFPFQDPRGQAFLRQVKPENISDLITAYALDRPGPEQAGLAREYVHRKHGRQHSDFTDPTIANILAETHGLPIFQEQIMRLLNRLAGMELSAAAAALRALIKKDRTAIEELRDACTAGAGDRGIDQAHEAFALVEQYGPYACCKARAAGYAHFAYQLAYLKARHPEEFRLACGR